VTADYFRATVARMKNIIDLNAHRIGRARLVEAAEIERVGDDLQNIVAETVRLIAEICGEAAAQKIRDRVRATISA
jgi:hypothetical protein